MFKYKVIRKVDGEEDKVVFVTTNINEALYKATNFINVVNSHCDEKDSKIKNYVIEKYELKKPHYGILRLMKNINLNICGSKDIIEDNLTKEEALKHINAILLTKTKAYPKYEYFYRLIER